MDDGGEVALERDDDALPEAAEPDHGAALKLRRLDARRPQQEWARDAAAQERVAGDAALEGFEVDDDVREFGHGSQVYAWGASFAALAQRTPRGVEYRTSVGDLPMIVRAMLCAGCCVLLSRPPPPRGRRIQPRPPRGSRFQGIGCGCSRRTIPRRRWCWSPAWCCAAARSGSTIWRASRSAVPRPARPPSTWTAHRCASSSSERSASPSRSRRWTRSQ